MIRVQRPTSARLKKLKTLKQAPEAPTSIMDLPPEINELISSNLDAKSLVTLASVCRLLNHQTAACPRWKQLFQEAYGITPLQIEAQALAGGWRQLLASKATTEKSRPCKWEVKAFLKGLVTTGVSTGAGVAVCALLDGSGSMGKGDFDSMKALVEQLASALTDIPDSQMSVVQFSSDAKVEIQMQWAATLDCAAALRGVSRIGSGTNFINAFAAANKEMQGLAPGVARIIVLMSDFRVDEYGAEEAVSSAQAVVEKHGNTAIFAVGVGRFLDHGLVCPHCNARTSVVSSVLQIGVQDSCPSRYISLGFQKDSPEDYY